MECQSIVRLWVVFLVLLSGARVARGSPNFDDSRLQAQARVLRGVTHLLLPARRITIVGDSLSDTEGRTSALSHGFVPLAPFYWRGRFSNGPLWEEYVGGALPGVQVRSLAYAGARIAERAEAYGTRVALPVVLSVPAMDVPSLADQVAELEAARTHFGNEDVVVFWGGSNDYFLNPGLQKVPSYLAATEGLLKRLITMGARRILVGLLPHVQGLPTYSEGIDSLRGTPVGDVEAQVEEHNRGLRQLVERLAGGPARGLSIESFDMGPLLSEMVDRPRTFGLSNVTQACFIGTSPRRYELPFPPLPPLVLAAALQTCSEPGRFLFWDAWHPTTKVHCHAAVSILDQLAEHRWVAGFAADQARARCAQLP